MKIFNLTQKTMVADKVRVARSFGQRLIGLIGRWGLAKNEALVIPRCQAIHMFFMLFSIDAVFLDDGKRAVACLKGLPPFSLSSFYPRASLVIELPSGTIARTKTQINDVFLLGE